MANANIKNVEVRELRSVDPGHKPVYVARAGTVTASVWKNKTKDEDKEYYSITIQKQYKEKDSDDWKESKTFFVDDLPKLKLVLDSCYQYCVLKIRED